MKTPLKIALALATLLLLICAFPLTSTATSPTAQGTHLGRLPLWGSSCAAGERASLPNHTVTLYDGGDPISEISVTDGDTLKDLPAPTREGYKLVGWRTGSPDGDLFEPHTKINCDLKLFAAYELLPPSFEISALSFTYDGRAHTLAFSSLTHPLLDGGVLSYEWYRDGAPVGAYGASLPLTNVSDSGEYSCRLVFSVGGDVTEITTPAVSVTISKCAVPLPTLEPFYYTAEPQTPPIYSGGIYTVDRTPHTLAGTYPVTLTLTDPDNYSFQGTDKPTATVDMVILPAENIWVTPPTVTDIYSSFSPAPTAVPRFGTPRFLYSSDGVVYTPDIPTAPGSYLMRAEVDGTENYSALISDPIPFAVLAEQVVGIAVKTPADKMTYRAFERFDPTGITVGVTYNSGRCELVGADSIGISYQQSDTFRYRDSGVIITYGGASVLLRTTVLRAKYDLSGISLPDVSATYSGAFITHTYRGTLPTGLDGVPLVATVTGGGTEAGKYTVTLTFSTLSDDYDCPEPMTATLTVLPYSAAVVWSDLSFVYDGSAKLPEAYYLDVHGRKVTLLASGAHTYAGSYTATDAASDPNYTLINPTAAYEILKADYDMSGALWQGGGETYDGGEKSVFLTGLPSGVTVIGYVNSTAINAGEYTATAALTYDSANYNPPTAPAYTWRILKAVYPTDGFAFSDTLVTYDGGAHYPLFEGEMPTGLDGISLEYFYSASATHVADGRVAVEVVFTTKSGNYTVPDTLIRYVEITPRDITVTWQNLEFRYTGATFLPSAAANECEIAVFGGESDAGSYTATASALNTDYRVTNATCTYVILKAANAWLMSLEVSDVFFGRAPAPTATPLAGEVVYTYFKDPECTDPIDGTPSSVGIYYVVAHSAGDKNHDPITSPPLAFEIVAITPVALEITPDNSEYTATGLVSFSAALLNNDGSRTPIDQSLVTVRYQSGDSLRFGDTSVTFSYGDMTATVTVSVEKCTVPLPHLDPLEYNGTPQAPVLDGSPLYTATTTAAITPGSYPVTLTLTDPHNYTFGTSDTATVYFVIAPRRITVTVSDVNLHLFENDLTLDWRITAGTLVGTDTLTPTFRIVDDRIFADFTAENYELTVIPGSINRLPTLSRRATSLLLLIILILIAIALAVIALVVNRRRIVCRVYTTARVDAPAPPPPTEPESEPEPANIATVVDAEYADTAITNSLAKDLIRRDEDVVTSGHRHGIVNVDTLSRSFSAGDRVDINTLKSHSLIPYDTAYIKVLARGMIDKPLCVYANDFSLSAVKMIALTGGKAVKVNTVVKKKK